VELVVLVEVLIVSEELVVWPEVLVVVVLTPTLVVVLAETEDVVVASDDVEVEATVVVDVEVVVDDVAEIGWHPTGMEFCRLLSLLMPNGTLFSGSGNTKVSRFTLVLAGASNTFCTSRS